MQHNIITHYAKPAWMFGIALLLTVLTSVTQWVDASELDDLFSHPPEAARPWVFWYWIEGCISREGITSDLEAMKRVGLGGAYLMSIKGPTDPPLLDPPVVQLNPEWWDMVRHAMKEADRLGLKLGMHACDGFAVAGGPWISPELSMQKVVSSVTQVEGPGEETLQLPEPQSNEGYYQDIAVLAFPSLEGTGRNTDSIEPTVSTSMPDVDASFLAQGPTEQRVRMEKPGWIQYEFSKPFVCRSITITPDGNNFQAQRLLLQASNDGKTFRDVCRLKPPRHGWQNGDGQVTHAIPPTTALFFRFLFDKTGSEPGAEDLDFAKWSPVLKIRSIQLSSEPRVHQFRGKTGEVWRVSERTTPQQISDAECINLDSIIDLSDRLDDGTLTWDVPQGKWTVLRIGHTSTASRNETGGGGKGLECDKLNPRAVQLQFDHWFGEAIHQVGPALSNRVLSTFHVDSWECGSQNWTPGFAEQFKQKRGYDLTRYLPALTGRPVESADASEQFLHDFRQTISELLQESFFDTMARLSHENGCQFSAECTAPTMLGDGMQHFARVDIPMGEFWLESPTHDKPNDIRDAVSGAHVYGKRIVQAEAFTQLRMTWDEYPGMLKSLGDLYYCLGINRLVFHVCVQNPWLDRQPGMTLDNIGLYFQRDQTWWDLSRAWIGYATRCQALLQYGEPVVDIAVFTGEELPRRAVLPERLTNTLPGLVGEERVASEQRRLRNSGEPTLELPRGVKHSANMADPEDWIDSLNGYAYDSINREALLSMTCDESGRIKADGSPAYRLLVVPASRPMSPDASIMSREVAEQLRSIAESGGQMLLCDAPRVSPGLGDSDPNLSIGSKVLSSPLHASSLSHLGIEPDFLATTAAGEPAERVGWVHRRSEKTDLYFVSNQSDETRTLTLSFRVEGKIPEIWDPLTGQHWTAKTWQAQAGRTSLPVRFEPSGALFLVFRTPTTQKESHFGNNWSDPKFVQQIEGPWEVQFMSKAGRSVPNSTFRELIDWKDHPDESIRHFSGTADYNHKFDFDGKPESSVRYWLDLGKTDYLAEVILNGMQCGIAWTAPYCVDITDALEEGENDLEIHVTNTWYNRLIGEQSLPESQRSFWTRATILPKGNELRSAGLLGPIRIVAE